MPERRRFERTPDTVCLLAGLTLVAMALTMTGTVPVAVTELVPLLAGRVWSGALALAAGTSLAGILVRDPLTGWYLELYGRIALALITAGYAIALAGDADEWEVALVVTLVAALAVSSTWRAWQAHRRLRAFRALLAARGEP